MTTMGILESHSIQQVIVSGITAIGVDRLCGDQHRPVTLYFDVPGEHGVQFVRK